MRFCWLKRQLRALDDVRTAGTSLGWLSDRDLRDIGLMAGGIETFRHAPVDVSNDRV